MCYFMLVLFMRMVALCCAIAVSQLLNVVSAANAFPLYVLVPDAFARSEWYLSIALLASLVQLFIGVWYVRKRWQTDFFCVASLLLKKYWVIMIAGSAMWLDAVLSLLNRHFSRVEL
eukprot:TRINITY_DN17926_c0_g4_i1.p1 TRINITY_DN17926_c0_g4~~TRINITY_DN17926_c0_g4_i1.p1  ORF type:complete len:117 (-),score=18.83 TRINITY_DN17926_c0_g4_i1:90-440(-)